MKPTAPQTGERAKPRILIADDHPQGVELLEAYLDKDDYEIRTAADGEETLALVRDWQPDLILLDIMMPKISGFEVCKRLRSDASTSNIAILMITALDLPSDIERALDVRADDFVTKPINKSELLVRVRALLEARHEKNELKRTLAYYKAVDQSKP